jgi:hypothetical protein
MNAVIANGRTIEKLLINNKTAKYMMNRKDILILHNAGVVRRVPEKKIIHTTIPPLNMFISCKKD